MNPLPATTITDVLISIVKFLLGLSAILAFLALIVGGIYMIISFGEESRLKQGKTIITWSVIGIVIIMLSYTIIKVVSDTLIT